MHIVLHHTIPLPVHGVQLLNLPFCLHKLIIFTADCILYMRTNQPIASLALLLKSNLYQTPYTTEKYFLL